MDLAMTSFGARADRRVGPVRDEAPAPTDLSPVRPRVLLQDLLHGTKEIMIVHGAQEYRLRLTRNGKLILTK